MLYFANCSELSIVIALRSWQFMAVERDLDFFGPPPQRFLTRSIQRRGERCVLAMMARGALTVQPVEGTNG